jgi:hypothetical protein
MTQLNKIQSIIFLAGGALMVIGAGCFAMMWQQRLTCWVFLLGALMFTTMQQSRPTRVPTSPSAGSSASRACQPDVHPGRLSHGRQRLRVLPSAFSNAVDYVNYIFNKWVILLLAAAIWRFTPFIALITNYPKKT